MDRMAWWESVLQGLLFFLPAYVANMSPVFVAKLIPAWKAPIDGGRLAKDGKRLLGPGKTWRGLTGGAFAGALTSAAVAWLVPPEGGRGPFAGWDYGLAEGSGWVGIVLFGAIVGFAALVGDAVKSYFKRRTGRDRGQPWVPFDQLDFVVFGLAFAFLTGPFLLADGWLLDHLLGSWWVLGTIVLLTPLLHFLVNVIGYFLRLKEVPW